MIKGLIVGRSTPGWPSTWAKAKPSNALTAHAIQLARRFGRNVGVRQAPRVHVLFEERAGIIDGGAASLLAVHRILSRRNSVGSPLALEVSAGGVRPSLRRIHCTPHAGWARHTTFTLPLPRGSNSQMTERARTAGNSSDCFPSSRLFRQCPGHARMPICISSRCFACEGTLRGSRIRMYPRISKRRAALHFV